MSRRASAYHPGPALELKIIFPLTTERASLAGIHVDPVALWCYFPVAILRANLQLTSFDVVVDHLHSQNVLFAIALRLSLETLEVVNLQPG